MPLTNLPPGPDLDRLVCEAMTRAGCAGWEPIPWYALSRDGGETMINWGDWRTKLEQWLADHPLLEADGFVIVEKHRYPRISTDWAVAGRALEAIHGLGLDYALDNLGHPPDIVRCIITKWGEDFGTKPFGSGEAPTGPNAIALAILAALEAPCE